MNHLACIGKLKQSCRECLMLENQQLLLKILHPLLYHFIQINITTKNERLDDIIEPYLTLWNVHRYKNLITMSTIYEILDQYTLNLWMCLDTSYTRMLYIDLTNFSLSRENLSWQKTTKDTIFHMSWNVQSNLLAMTQITWN